LTLTDEECADFTGQLDDVLDFAERIRVLDTEGVPPTSHALLVAGLGGANAFREDEPKESLERDRVLDGAPDSGAGLFKVPKVLP